MQLLPEFPQLIQKIYVVFVFKCTKVTKKILIGFSVSVIGGCMMIALMQMILSVTCIVGNYSVPIVLCKLLTDFIHLQGICMQSYYAV